MRFSSAWKWLFHLKNRAMFFGHSQAYDGRNQSMWFSETSLKVENFLKNQCVLVYYHTHVKISTGNSWERTNQTYACVIPVQCSMGRLCLSCNFSFPELKVDGWTKHNFHTTFDLNLDSFTDNVPRINCNEISHEEFIEKYERPLKPVVITYFMDSWPAMRRWTLEVIFNIN